MSFLLVDILHNRPCDTDTIVGTRSASQLIKEHQTALAQVIQYAGCLVHLYHEGTLARGYIIAGTDTCEDFVHHTYARALCWHKTTHLRHEHDQCRLTK